VYQIELLLVTIIATCSAGNYCRKSGGHSYLGYTPFNGAAKYGPSPPHNLTATCIKKRESKWAVTIQWDTVEGKLQVYIPYVGCSSFPACKCVSM
jgi:hypothetical protein